MSIGAGGASPYLWVLDPVDGTKSFITGAIFSVTLVSQVCLLLLCCRRRRDILVEP